MKFDEDADPVAERARARAAARRKARLKTLLLFGILMVLSGTLLVMKLFEYKREAAREAQAQRPEARARRALEDADRATVNQDLAGARVALEAAHVAIEEAAAARPDALDVAHSRVTVRRRLAYLLKQTRQLPEARQRLRDALVAAEAVLQAHPTLDRAREDTLTTARELASLLGEAAQALGKAGPAGAVGAGAGDAASPLRTEIVAGLDAAAAAVRAVEAGFEGLVPAATLRAHAADAWLEIALARQALGDGVAAAAAGEAAVREATAAVKGDRDPEQALGRQYQVTAAVALMLDGLQHPAAEDYERRTVQVLRLRLKLDPDREAVRRLHGTWLGRLGIRLADARRDAEARPVLEEAVALRRSLLAAKPDDVELRRDLVRALNAVGVWHSEGQRDAEAATAYADSVAAAEPLGDDRVRLVALGNQAQVLGRLDQMAAAKAAAATGYAIAERLAQAPGADAEVRLDAARAGLRHARLLRADPKPDKAAAAAVLKAARAHLGAAPALAAAPVVAGLTELATELGVAL